MNPRGRAPRTGGLGRVPAAAGTVPSVRMAWARRGPAPRASSGIAASVGCGCRTSHPEGQGPGNRRRGAFAVLGPLADAGDLRGALALRAATVVRQSATAAVAPFTAAWSVSAGGRCTDFAFAGRHKWPMAGAAGPARTRPADHPAPGRPVGFGVSRAALCEALCSPPSVRGCEAAIDGAPRAHPGASGQRPHPIPAFPSLASLTSGGAGRSGRHAVLCPRPALRVRCNGARRGWAHNGAGRVMAGARRLTVVHERQHRGAVSASAASGQACPAICS